MINGYQSDYFVNSLYPDLLVVFNKLEIMSKEQTKINTDP